MAKAPKAPATPVTDAHIHKAAESNVIKQLVDVANAFTRAGVGGPFATDLTILGSVMIKEKSYRKTSIEEGTRVNAKDIAIGARAGLIFRFDVVGSMKNPHGEALWIELSWDDVVNVLGDFSEKVESRLNDNTKPGDGLATIKQIDSQVKAAINANKAMHKVLTEGFGLAQKRGREVAQDESLTTISGYGSFS